MMRIFSVTIWSFMILAFHASPIFSQEVPKNWTIKPLGEAGRLQFRTEFFNALNTPQFGAPNNIGWSSATSVAPDAPQMGEIRSLALPMRIIQFGMKLYF